MEQQEIHLQRVETLVRGTFSLPHDSDLRVEEINEEGRVFTRITLLHGDHEHPYEIDAPMEKVSLKAIRALETPKIANRTGTFKGHFFRFLAFWGAFTGFFATATVCPFCGAPGCPVGLGTASLFGGFFALATSRWQVISAMVRAWFVRTPQGHN